MSNSHYEGRFGDWRIGQIVRIHPATDLFMRGVSHARITKLGYKWMHIHHHDSGTNHRVSYDWAKTNMVAAGEQFKS